MATAVMSSLQDQSKTMRDHSPPWPYVVHGFTRLQRQSGKCHGPW